jgi:sterol 14-demethylase
MTFAYLQVKAIWSVLLRRFELELIDRHPEPNYATFVVGPKPPCRLRYRRKQPAAVHAPGHPVPVTTGSRR